MGVFSDDDELLSALRQAVRAREAVPSDFVAAAKSAFAWHNIDADLAELTFDSLRDTELAGIRAESAAIRALTFTSPQLTVELEVAGDTILGQLIPAGPGTVTVIARSGQSAEVAADEIGCFALHPLPAGPFRLRCRAEIGEAVTGWIEL